MITTDQVLLIKYDTSFNNFNSIWENVIYSNKDHMGVNLIKLKGGSLQ